MAAINDRVGAVLCMDKNVIEFLGYGVFHGDDFIPPGYGGFLGALHGLGMKTPKIVLDSGVVVWGCECWWSPEEAMKKDIADRLSRGWTLVEVDINNVRSGVT